MTGEEIYDKNVETQGGIGDGGYLRNKACEKVVSGIYTYVISTEDGDKKVGKIGAVK